jgi:hypothetical protein
MTWIPTEGKVPDNDRVVRIAGIMTAEATWNHETKSWEMTQDSKINCNVTGWQEIEKEKEHGSTNQEVSAV